MFSSLYKSLLKKAFKEIIPLNVTFELTHHCNLHCFHCYIMDKKDKNELSFTAIKRILNQLADCGTLYLTLTGGEILIRKDFFNIAQYARKKHFALRLLTNGTLLTSEIAKKICGLYPISVEISVYGATPNTHDSITGLHGSYKRTLFAVDLLTTYGVNVILKTPLIKQNIGEYNKLKKLGRNLGLKIFFDMIITPTDDGSRDVLACRISDDDIFYVLSNEISETKSCLFQLGNGSPRKDDYIKWRPCGAGITGCRISPTGLVYPCLQILQPAGDLKKDNFHTIWWNSEVFERLRKIRLSGLSKCKNCNLFQYCFRCAGLSLLEDGSLLGPSTEACRLAKIRKKIHEQSFRNS